MTNFLTALRLRTQLALAFGLLTLTLSTFLSLALGTMLYRQIEREQGDELATVSKNAARVLADDLRKNARSVQIVAASTALWLDGLESPGVDAALARLKAVNSDIGWIGVADTSGIVRAATEGLLVGEDIAARPWFEPGLRGIHVGDVHEAKLLAGRLPPTASGEPRRFVDFAAPIRLGGRLLGVLVIHGRWEWADEVVQKLAPENARALNIETFIFDRDGRPIFAPDGGIAPLLASGQRLPSEVKRTAAVVPWSAAGRHLTASARLPEIAPSIDLGWTVVTRQPEATAFVGARNAQRAALALGAVAAVLSVALAWLLAGRLARPLTGIAQAARRVSEGSSSMIPSHGGSREVIELSESLAEMTGRLLSAKDELEARIAERTEALAKANAELSGLALRDPLTGVLNRRGFEEHVSRVVSAARRSGAPVGVVVVDADHFKRVNDGLGHAAGDMALKALASAMAATLRECDIVGRLGGEEFAAVLSGCGAAGALVAAEKICAAMRALAIDGIGTVTVSCGAAELELPGGDLAAAMARADEALYRAKREGRDRACCQPSLVASKRWIPAF